MQDPYMNQRRYMFETWHAIWSKLILNTSLSGACQLFSVLFYSFIFTFENCFKDYAEIFNRFVFLQIKKGGSVAWKL